MITDQMPLKMDRKKSLQDFFKEKPRIFFPALISLTILIISLFFSVITTTGSTLTDESLTTQERYLTFFISLILLIFSFLIGQLFLITYLFLAFKAFRHYLEFKLITSVILVLSIIRSLGELVNSVSEAFFSIKYLTYLTTYINSDSFWVNVTLRPVEIFNLLSLALLALILKKISSLPLLIISIIMLPIILGQIMQGSFSHLVEVLFS